MSGDKPVVTYIVAGPDSDPDGRFARCVSSALGQSMRSVEVVVVGGRDAALPADRRLRRMQPDGQIDIGAARGDALHDALGEFVVFLDPRHELDRNAARAAVAAARENGADLVVSRMQRADGRCDAALTDLFRHTTHYSSAAERSELLRDASIANKMFATSFLRRAMPTFGDATSCPDLQFVTQAYVLADGITVIPQRLVVEHDEAPRADPDELLATHQALDRFLAERLETHQGVAELTVAKAARFLEVDMPSYLLSASELSDDRALVLLRSLSDYMATMHEDALTAVDPIVRIAVFMVRRQDLAGVREVVDFLVHGRRITTRLVQRDGRVYWTDRYLDSDEGRRVLDVTGVESVQLQLSALQLASRVDEVEMRGRRALFRGHTDNQLGRLTPDAAVQLLVQEAPDGAGRTLAVPADVVRRTADAVSWEATLDLDQLVRRARVRSQTWSLRLSLTVGTESGVVPLTAYDDPTLRERPLGRRMRWLPAGNTLRTHVTETGELQLRLSPEGPLAESVAIAAAPFVRAPRVRSDEEALTGVIGAARRFLRSTATKSLVHRTVLVRLPLKPRSVVFESHLGRSFSDNPKYVFEELYRRDAGFEFVWSFADDPPVMPPGVRTVRRESWRYFLALARARYWVDNQGLPHTVTKPPRTTYLQTWHGSALKRMGEDMRAFRTWSKDRRDRHRAMVARWDYFVTRSEHDVRTLVPALHVRGEILRSGYPRNDPLVHLRTDEQRAAVRTQLGLPPDAVLVLYAPTFRQSYATGLQDFELQIDLDQMMDKLPGHLLLLRTHYLQQVQGPVAAHRAVRDVSHHPDITPLLVAADILVTDYSSVMFDFANTGRPMIFYAYDYDDYANSERGVYWDLAEQAPGPLVHTSDELLQALCTVDTWRPDYDERYRRFVAEFGEYDTGDAARQVVDRVFFGSGNDR